LFVGEKTLEEGVVVKKRWVVKSRGDCEAVGVENCGWKH